MRARPWPLPLLLLLAAAGGLHASPSQDDSAEALLRKADSADHRVAYSGTKVVRRYCTDGASPVSQQEVRVWHQPPDKTRIEVLPPSEAAGMVILEAEERRCYYYPWRQQWLSAPIRPFHAPLPILLRNYAVQAAATDTIAGRQAVLVQIRARRPGGRARNTWIDRRTGVVLKNELLDEQGHRISSWQFREIDFPQTVSAALFTVPAQPPDPERAAPAAPRLQRIEKPDFVVVQPRFLPPGFTEVRRSAYRARGFDRVFVRYTDGLNFIFLVQQRCDPNEKERFGGRRDRPGDSRGPVPPDAVSARRYRDRRPPVDDGDVAIRLSWRQGDLRFTLVGGVERAVLERMATSMTPPSMALQTRGASGGR